MTTSNAYRKWLEPTIRKITLMNSKDGDDLRSLIARVDDDGHLRFDGHDLGPTVARFFPADEYEYVRKVSAEYVERVVLELLNEDHPDNAQARSWLAENWITLTRKEKTTALLKLIRARFSSDVDFADWLKVRQIPSEFWSSI